jgi:hypothetical protein
LWILVGIGFAFNDFENSDPDWESGYRIRIQGPENEGKMYFFSKLNFIFITVK